MTESDCGILLAILIILAFIGVGTVIHWIGKALEEIETNRKLDERDKFRSFCRSEKDVIYEAYNKHKESKI